MNTPREEIPEDGNQRRKSMGSGGGGGSNLAGSKARRYSIGATSSRKSIGEEGNTVPNYLRASTGSCHDFCKYGKKHEHSNSSIPIKFKRTTSVNKEKVTVSVFPPERKKMTTVTKLKPSAEPIEVTKKDVLLPSKKPQVSKQVLSVNGKATENELKTLQQSTFHVKRSPVTVNSDSSSGSNGGIKKKGIKTLKKTGMTPKIAPVKKVIPKSTLNESQSPKASFSRAASSKTLKYRSIKQVSPLKDQNMMQKTRPKQTIGDKVQTKTLNVVEAEPEVKSGTVEFDFVHPSTELINDPVCNTSESFSGKNFVEELMISHPVNENSEPFSDKELLEESVIAPLVVESSQSCSDKEVLEEESLIAPPVVESSQSCSDKEILEEESLIAPPMSESSESFYDDEVLEDESEYTDDDDEEVDVYEEGSEAVKSNEVDTLVGNQNKIPRKGRMVISEEKDDEAVKLRFRRGRVIDLQSENNGPRRLKFRRRIMEVNEDGQSITVRGFKNKTSDIQAENHVPRRLKFTKGKVMEDNEEKIRVARRSFEKKFVDETNDSNKGPESVVLKHQGEQGKKDAQGLFNNVIEETASKLVESRKSKVKALVGAFETVISLQDGKPTST